MSVINSLGYIPLHVEETEDMDSGSKFVSFDGYDRLKTTHRSTVLLAYPGDGLTTTALSLLREYRSMTKTLVISYSINADMHKHGNRCRVSTLETSHFLVAMANAMFICLEQQQKATHPWIDMNVDLWSWWIAFWGRYLPHIPWVTKANPYFPNKKFADSNSFSFFNQNPITLPLDRLLREMLLPRLATLGVERIIFLMRGFSKLRGSTKSVRGVVEEWLGDPSLHDIHYQEPNKRIEVLWKWFLPLRFQAITSYWHQHYGAEFDIVILKWSTEQLKDILNNYSITGQYYQASNQELDSFFRLENLGELQDGWDPIQYRLILMAILQERYGRLRALSILSHHLDNSVKSESNGNQGLTLDIWKKFKDNDLPLILPSSQRYDNPFTNSYLVAIGANEYGSSRLRNLTQAVKDAEDFEKLLGQRGYSASNLYLFTDQTPKHKRTKGEILAVLQNIKVEKGDVVIFFFAGHGTWGKTLDESCLCLWDYSPSNPEIDSISASELGLALTKLAETGANVVAILDSCYAGQFVDVARGSDAITEREPFEMIRENFRSDRWNLLASTLPNQPAYEDAKKGNGDFSRNILEGIRVDLDTIDPSNKCISLFRLYAYAERKMNEVKPALQTSIARIHHEMPIALARLYPHTYQSSESRRVARL